MKKSVFAVGLVAAITLTSGAAMAADAAAGEKLAKQRCVACHTFEQGGANKVGPNLFNVIERGPNKAEGFKYSEGYNAAAAAGFTWTDETLDEYLADPTAFLRHHAKDDKARSKMTFKLAKPEERADVIAYLHTLK
jgi:cytochrome c